MSDKETQGPVTVDRPVRCADGTVSLPADVVAQLADIIAEWESGGHWTKRDDCQNWKRSTIARENRRETITLHNCAGQIKALIGRDILRI
jgi:hypothetical protein